MLILKCMYIYMMIIAHSMVMLCDAWILIHPDLGRITTQNKWQTMWHLTLSQPLRRPAVVLSTG
jgi:hypothetical protein